MTVAGLGFWISEKLPDAAAAAPPTTLRVARLRGVVDSSSPAPPNQKVGNLAEVNGSGEGSSGLGNGTLSKKAATKRM